MKEERHKERAAGKGNNKREGRSASALRLGCCCFALLLVHTGLAVMVSQVRCEARRANGGWKMERVAQCIDARVGCQLPATLGILPLIGSYLWLLDD